MWYLNNISTMPKVFRFQWKYSVHVCSVVPDFATPWTVAQQTPLSMGFFRQEYQSGLLFPTPGDLPDSGIEPASPATPALAGRFFTPETSGKSIEIFETGETI